MIVVPESLQEAMHEAGARIYRTGRVTWDGKGLSQYVQTHPEVQQFRRVAPPSVSLRYEHKDRDEGR